MYCLNDFITVSMHLRVLIINNPNFDFLEGNLWFLTKFSALNTADHLSNYDFKECKELRDKGW